MATKAAIQLRQVSKVFHTQLFRTTKALDQVSLEIPYGTTTAFVGHNGSGKSTTFKILAGFLKATLGTVTLCGYNPSQKQARRFLGYLPENPKFPRHLNAIEAMFFLGALSSIEKKELERKSQEVLERVKLSPFAKDRISGFSKGMTQRLALAQAILHSPSVLLLDEPMSGLDPQGRKEILDILKELKSAQPEMTLIFSTHTMQHIEELESSVVVLSKGKLIAHLPPQNIPTENHFVVLAKGALPSRFKTQAKIQGSFFQFETANVHELGEFLSEIKKHPDSQIVSVRTENTHLEFMTRLEKENPTNL